MSDTPAPVALIFNFGHHYCRQVLRGIRQFARTTEWALHPIVPQQGLRAMLEQLKPVGIIAHAFNRQIAESLVGFGQPVVNVSRAYPAATFPQVNVEEARIGEMVASHFIECGLRHFGYFGPSRFGEDSGREGGFYAALKRVPHTISTLHTRPSDLDPNDTQSAFTEEARRWIRNLPKPAGVFTMNDTWGLCLSDLCQFEGVKIPDEISIVGVDNDELLCELATPTLSSVVIPAERIGYEAASLVQRMLAGREPPSEPLLLPPLGLVARQSSDMLAVEDADLAAAIQFIRKHAMEPISVTDILDHVLVSRRSLERLFRSVLGHGPSQEIRRLRIAKSKSLLADSDVQISDIAYRCGFSNAKQFSTAFHQVTGLTPSSFRRQVDTAIKSSEQHILTPPSRQRTRF